MAETRNNCQLSGNQNSRNSVCIDVKRVLDSCRDKDCFEDIEVFLTECGQEIIEKAGSVRVKYAKLLWTHLSVEPVQFNSGFYRIFVKFYSKIVGEACVPGGRSQEFEGIAVSEKHIILYGGEGNVNIFRSGSGKGSFCTDVGMELNELGSNLPIAVCEVAEPVTLAAKICEPRAKNYCRCCCLDEIPEHVCCGLSDRLCDPGEEGRRLVVTLGYFSVVRLERPWQYIINASECCVPDKECDCGENEDPCSIFKKMSFPVSEFCGGSGGSK